MILFASFSHWCYLFFHRSPTDGKSSQVSRTFVSILDNLNNVLIWMVSILFPISSSSRLPFQAFDDSSKCSNYNWYHRHPLAPQLFSIFFDILFVVQNRLDDKFAFLVNYYDFFFLAMIRWPVCISKFQRIFCVLFTCRDFGFCIYHLILSSKSNFLHNSQRITFPIQACLLPQSNFAKFAYYVINQFVSITA